MTNIQEISKQTPIETKLHSSIFGACDLVNFEQLLLSQYSTETLRAELKRRNAEAKAIRQKEFDNAHRCRNCKFFERESNPRFNHYICTARMWGKKIKRYYIVNGSHGLQCNKFIHK